MTPQIEVRLAVTEDAVTRRADVILTGSSGVLVVDGVSTRFPSKDVWRVVRDLLPDVAHLRADPGGTHVPTGQAAPADLAESAQALVVVATGARGPGETEGTVVLRTWVATEDEVYAVQPGEVTPSAHGAFADLLVWDITGAMERLVSELESAS